MTFKIINRFYISNVFCVCSIVSLDCEIGSELSGRNCNCHGETTGFSEETRCTVLSNLASAGVNETRTAANGIDRERIPWPRKLFPCTVNSIRRTLRLSGPIDRRRKYAA